MDAEGRAADLLDRLEVLGMSQGVSEEDLYKDIVHQPLLTMCSKLADGLTSLPADKDVVQLNAAAENLKAVCKSQQGASDGRLDAALSKVVQALDPEAAEAAGGSSNSRNSRIVFVETAVAHLQAARILAYNQQQQQQQAGSSNANGSSAGDMEVDESADEAASTVLGSLAKLLKIDAQHSQAQPILSEVVSAVRALVPQLPAGFFQPLVQLDGLTPSQQDVLQQVDAALRHEYKLRRRVLIERIKVTLQSFLASPRVAEKGSKAELEALVAARQASLTEDPGVSLSDVPGVTSAYMASVMRRATSGEGGSFHTAIKRVVIGKVPDRGGRPEGRAREANMPEWAPRRADSGTGGGSSRGRGGYRGGRGGGSRWGKAGGGGSISSGSGSRIEQTQSGSSASSGAGADNSQQGAGGRRGGGWGRGRPY